MKNTDAVAYWGLRIASCGAVAYLADYSLHSYASSIASRAGFDALAGIVAFAVAARAGDSVNHIRETYREVKGIERK